MCQCVHLSLGSPEGEYADLRLVGWDVHTHLWGTSEHGINPRVEKTLNYVSSHERFILNIQAPGMWASCSELPKCEGQAQTELGVLKKIVNFRLLQAQIRQPRSRIVFLLLPLNFFKYNFLGTWEATLECGILTLLCGAMYGSMKPGLWLQAPGCGVPLFSFHSWHYPTLYKCPVYMYVLSIENFT